MDSVRASFFSATRCIICQAIFIFHLLLQIFLVYAIQWLLGTGMIVLERLKVYLDIRSSSNDFVSRYLRVILATTNLCQIVEVWLLSRRLLSVIFLHTLYDINGGSDDADYDQQADQDDQDYHQALVCGGFCYVFYSVRSVFSPCFSTRKGAILVSRLVVGEFFLHLNIDKEGVIKISSEDLGVVVLGADFADEHTIASCFHLSLQIEVQRVIRTIELCWNYFSPFVPCLVCVALFIPVDFEHLQPITAHSCHVDVLTERQSHVHWSLPCWLNKIPEHHSDIGVISCKSASQTV